MVVNVRNVDTGRSQEWIYWGGEGGGGGGGGGGAPPSTGQRGCRGVLFFMIKQKNIRGKMRHSNLSKNMMISEL